MSSFYPSPPNSPSLTSVSSKSDLAYQPELSSTKDRTYAPLTPPATPSKKGSATVVTTLAVPVPIDAAVLENLLGLSNRKCGSPTKYPGEPPCRSYQPNSAYTKRLILSMTTLTQASPELDDQLEMLAKPALCSNHCIKDLKGARIKVWKKVFPIGDETAVPIEPIEDRIKSELNCFPYTSTYTCIGADDGESTPCTDRIGGKKVRKGKSTIALIIKPENYSDDNNLLFLLRVLADNVMCHDHKEGIPNRVAKWKSRITEIYKAYPVPAGIISSTGNMKVSPKYKGNPANFWDDADDTSAFVTEVEKDRPSSQSDCYSLVQEKLKEPLKVPELNYGHVYVYEVEGNKGFVKIGYTTKSIEDRLADWKTQCDRVPKLLYPLKPTAKIPHANRVEGLCLAELKYANRTVICEACPRRHVEWNQIPAAKAIATIEKWTKWIHTSPFEDTNKPITRWESSHQITSWRLRDDEAKRTVDMPNFMQEIAAASLPTTKQISTGKKETLAAVAPGH